MHPRPLLTRPGWRDLCGTWQFAFDDDATGVNDQWQRRADPYDMLIEVPFPFESRASGIADTSFHPVVWYRREFTAQAQPGRRTLLHFGAVDYRAHVWVNGHAVARHEGGHTPFSADITSVLDESGEQVVVVRAEDVASDLQQPRGKQDWQATPHGIWYDRTTGIWQPVWLEDVPETRIGSLAWTPDVPHRSLDLSVRIVGIPPEHERRPQGGLRLHVVITRGEQVVADDSYAVSCPEVQRRITVMQSDVSLGHSDLLWSPESPNLLEAKVSLVDDGEVVDEVGSYTALRSLEAVHDRLLLNGRPYYLKLVLAQNFWPESHLAAPDADALRREVQLVKDLGFNGVRLHQKVEDPRFLAWCDRLGVLVWAEMPAAYEFSTETVARLTREWVEVLERDRSHPCIVAWVPVNESWGVPALTSVPAQRHLVHSLYHLTKAFDPTRVVIGNDGWEQLVTDVYSVHDYTSRGPVLTERYGSREALHHTLEHIQPSYRSLLLPGAKPEDAPVLISEFGGISFDPDRREGWSGYGSVGSSQELADRYEDLVGALLDSPAIAGFCWTQLTDTQQERNGLLTADRVPKVPIHRISEITSRVSAAVAGDAVSESAYSNVVTGLVVEE